jgi:hypothetical protein
MIVSRAGLERFRYFLQSPVEEAVPADKNSRHRNARFSFDSPESIHVSTRLYGKIYAR